MVLLDIWFSGIHVFFFNPWFSWIFNSPGFMIFLDALFHLMHGSLGSMVLLGPCYLGSLVLLGPWLSWIHGFPGYMIFLDVKFYWMHGSLGFMVFCLVLLDLWFSWIKGFPGSIILLDAWFSWIHGILYIGSIVLLAMFS